MSNPVRTKFCVASNTWHSGVCSLRQGCCLKLLTCCVLLRRAPRGQRWGETEAMQSGRAPRGKGRGGRAAAEEDWGRAGRKGRKGKADATGEGRWAHGNDTALAKDRRSEQKQHSQEQPRYRRPTCGKMRTPRRCRNRHQKGRDSEARQRAGERTAGRSGKERSDLERAPRASLNK